MTIMNEEQKKYALDHYNAGFDNKTLLARMIIQKWNLDIPVEKLRRPLSSWLNRNAIKAENPALAKECEGIEQKNIYFAVNKELFFMGGINENAPLRIYDFEGNVYGSAPNLEYAKNHCEFYEESK